MSKIRLNKGEENNKELSSPQEPIQLFPSPPEAMEYPINALGITLGGATKAIMEITQAPGALCGQSILAAAALTVQGFCDVSIDSRVHPLSCFFITIGESGERKSAVDKMALKALREFEKTKIKKYDQELIEFQHKFKIFEAQERKLLNKKNKKTNDLEKEDSLNEELINPPKPPLSQLMMIEEPTYEGLLKLFEHGQPSLGLFSDEGGRMIGGVGMCDDQQLKTIAGFSSIWDGSSISKSRAGEGSKKLYGKRLSLHLMVQPEVSKLIVNNGKIRDQGFLSRCLLSYPKSNIGNRLYKTSNADDDHRLTNFYSAISEILKKPYSYVEGTNNELAPRTLCLASDAKEEWIKFHNEIEIEMKDNGIYSSIRGFASKSADYSLRIAGVLQLFEDFHSTKINLQILKYAIEIIKYYLSEQLRLAIVFQIDPNLIQADLLLKWLQGNSTVMIYSQKILQLGPNSLREKKAMENAIKILIEHGWLEEVTDQPIIDGKPRRKAWRLIQ